MEILLEKTSKNPLSLWLSFSHPSMYKNNFFQLLALKKAT
jgi:hypothetical protein